MATTTLKLWGHFSVNVESTEVLTSEEKAIVVDGLQKAFCWVLIGEPLPDFKEIRRNIDHIHPNISQKLRRVYWH